MKYEEFQDSPPLTVVFTDQVDEFKRHYFETVVIEDDGHDAKAVWVEIFGETDDT